MNQPRAIHPFHVAASVARNQGAIFDVRDGDSLVALPVRHFSLPLSDIEGFMKGTLAGMRAQALVSVLIFLTTVLPPVYIVANSDSEAAAAMGHLAKLGFRDFMLVLGGVTGFAARSFGPHIEPHLEEIRAAMSCGACARGA